MPLQYRRDELKRRFIVTLTGDVTIDDLASFVATQITLGLWPSGVLYDATADGVRLKPLGTMPLDLWRELRAEHARGPVAFVVADDQLRAIANGYVNAVAAAGLFTAALFSDVAAAERWLDTQAG